jgi:hypothetical protein
MHSFKSIGRFVITLLVSTVIIQAVVAQDAKKDKQAKKEAEIKNLVDSQSYMFKAQTVFPLGGRSRQLTSEYDVTVSKAAVVSYLPYFGRAYSATPGSSTGGIDFTSKEFEYNVTETKKGDWEIVIKPKDTKVARELNLTVFKNGSANLHVSSNDKQNISYSGYIAPPAKKK